MEKLDRKDVVRALMALPPLFRKKFLDRPNDVFAGLSRSQRSVIKSLTLYPALNMGQLSAEADVSLQQITKTVNALEDMGYVCRHTDKTNRRQVWVSLTPQCLERLRASFDTNDGLLVKWFQGLSDSDMICLQEAANRIIEIINRMEDRPVQEAAEKE